MTRCSGGPAEEMAARYLAGELSEPESEEFEDHFLGCDPCHRLVMTAQALAAELASEPAAMPAVMPRRDALNKSSGRNVLTFPGGFPIRISSRMVGFATLAAAMLIAVVLTGIFLKQSGTFDSETAGYAPPAQSPAPAAHTADTPSSAKPVSQHTGEMEIAALADLTLPGYQPGQLRDAESNDEGHLAFAAGMASYAKGDCREALTHLARTPSGSDDAMAAQLYSGLCHFDLRAFDQAQANFKHVIAAGDTPQLETAEYFTAQVHLIQNDAAGARTWLSRVIALRGDYEQRAHNQLVALTPAKQKP